MPLPDSDAFSTYGGALSDYGTGVVDPTTDRAASAANAAYCSVAMMTRTALRGHFAFATNGTSNPATPTSYEYVWKGSTTTAPTAARSSQGVYTFTLPTTVLDELGATHSVNLVRAWGQAQGSTAYHVQCSVSVNVITVRLFDMAGATTDGSTTTIDVFFC